MVNGEWRKTTCFPNTIFTGCFTIFHLPARHLMFHHLLFAIFHLPKEK